MLSPLASASARQRRTDLEPVLVDERAALDDRRRGPGRDRCPAAVRRCRTPERSTVPELLEEHLDGAVGELLLEQVAGLLLGIRLRIAEDETGARDDLQVVGVAAERTGAPLDVDVELLRLGEARVRREDEVGVRGGEVPALRRDPGLHEHRPPLRAARHGEPALDVELRAGVLERTGRLVREELARSPCRRRWRPRPTSPTARGRCSRTPRRARTGPRGRGSRRGGSSAR